MKEEIIATLLNEKSELKIEALEVPKKNNEQQRKELRNNLAMLRD